MPERISAVVSGSFKFKPEIDHTIDTLEETGISVLEPTKGWLFMPKFEVVKQLSYGQIRPLPTEETLTTRQIETRFLRALGRADLMYLMNPEQYVGLSGSFEMGYALALQKPVYALEPLDYDAMEIDDLSVRRVLDDNVTILAPENVADHYNNNFPEGQPHILL
jgi:nucleoside 2-deoxyribosyltransferase